MALRIVELTFGIVLVLGATAYVLREINASRERRSRGEERPEPRPRPRRRRRRLS